MMRAELAAALADTSTKVLLAKALAADVWGGAYALELAWEITPQRLRAEFLNKAERIVASLAADPDNAAPLPARRRRR